MSKLGPVGGPAWRNPMGYGTAERSGARSSLMLEDLLFEPKCRPPRHK